jgi:GDP-4-dehydro-6-deoxy-D-mannose reductase
MKVMITGATGFMGPFLTRHCLQAGCTVLGIDRRGSNETLEGATIESCDVRDEVRLGEVISRFRPERIFHLAAQSYPTVSMEQPRETFEINAGGTINLFEAIRAAGINPTVVVACSSGEYGPVESKDLPVREDHLLRPLHPYGVSKVAQDLLAAQYFANYTIPAIRIRIFNTTGPSKLADVCSDLTKRVVEIERGLHPPVLKVGNLTTRRVIADARDLVRGLYMASESCEPGDVYNLGAETHYSVAEIIDAIRHHVKVDFSIQQDPELMRRCDEPIIFGDISKFKSRTGWKTEFTLTRTLQDMLDWWRTQLASESKSATSK